MKIHGVFRAIDRFISGSENEGRLRQAIDDTWADFDDQIRQYGSKALQTPWAQCAVRNLLDAEQKLASGRDEQAWASASAAQRAILSNPANPERAARAAISLRYEAEKKITGWRADAIAELIRPAKGDAAPDPVKQQQRIVEAMSLRDDYNQNNYLKIALRRSHLARLARFLWTGILICFLASCFKALPSPYDNRQQVLLVLLFGIIGAYLSVSQGLLNTDVSAKIPAQQIGAFVVWMRPAIGAAAALLALALLNAKVLTFDPAVPGITYLFAFAAGYSERFIVGAIDKISPAKKSD
ncbi:MAG: hypothetical protein QOI05_41 [Bradyrhizobium sp.]|jgi:uncharacterized membrane protein|nr:hypothetical protein [Bradyrhizobium sp.]